MMQDNGHWAHPENVVIACLSDPSEEIRRKGVQFIRQARQAFDKEEDVRKFVPPKINFESNRFCDLVDLDSAEKQSHQ